MNRSFVVFVDPEEAESRDPGETCCFHSPIPLLGIRCSSLGVLVQVSPKKSKSRYGNENIKPAGSQVRSSTRLSSSESYCRQQTSLRRSQFPSIHLTQSRPRPPTATPHAKRSYAIDAETAKRYDGAATSSWSYTSSVSLNRDARLTRTTRLYFILFLLIRRFRPFFPLNLPTNVLVCFSPSPSDPDADADAEDDDDDEDDIVVKEEEEEIDAPPSPPQPSFSYSNAVQDSQTYTYPTSNLSPESARKKRRVTISSGSGPSLHPLNTATRTLHPNGLPRGQGPTSAAPFASGSPGTPGGMSPVVIGFSVPKTPSGVPSKASVDQVIVFFLSRVSCLCLFLLEWSYVGPFGFDIEAATKGSHRSPKDKSERHPVLRFTAPNATRQLLRLFVHPQRRHDPFTSRSSHVRGRTSTRGPSARQAQGQKQSRHGDHRNRLRSWRNDQWEIAVFAG